MEYTLQVFCCFKEVLSAVNVCTQSLLDHFHFFPSEAVLGIETITVHEEFDTTAEVCVVVREPFDINCPIVYPIDFMVEINDGTASM